MMNDYISEYYQEIKEGSVIAGKWIILLYEYIIRGLEQKEFYFAPKKANKAIKFIENYCHHSKGRNDLLKLELWQKALISTIFGIVDENNYRIFREIVLIVARKNGKSVLDSAIATYMLTKDNEGGAEIYSVATKREQSKIVWEESKRMIKKSPILAKRIRCLIGGIYYDANDSFFRALASDSNSLDGLNAHLVIADEVHA